MSEITGSDWEHTSIKWKLIDRKRSQFINDVWVRKSVISCYLSRIQVRLLYRFCVFTSMCYILYSLQAQFRWIYIAAELCQVRIPVLWQGFMINWLIEVELEHDLCIICISVRLLLLASKRPHLNSDDHFGLPRPDIFNECNRMASFNPRPSARICFTTRGSLVTATIST